MVSCRQGSKLRLDFFKIPRRWYIFALCVCFFYRLPGGRVCTAYCHYSIGLAAYLARFYYEQIQRTMVSHHNHSYGFRKSYATILILPCY